MRSYSKWVTGEYWEEYAMKRPTEMPLSAQQLRMICRAVEDTDTPKRRIALIRHMEKDYLDYGFHIRGRLKGQLIGLPVALLIGGFVALFALV